MTTHPTCRAADADMVQIVARAILRSNGAAVTASDKHWPGTIAHYTKMAAEYGKDYTNGRSLVTDAMRNARAAIAAYEAALAQSRSSCQRGNLTMTTDRAALEEALKHAERAWTKAPNTVRIVEAARAHLATLPRTKPVEVHLVARMSEDGTLVRCCYSDTPRNRATIERLIPDYGGQLVELRGIAQVPA